MIYRLVKYAFQFLSGGTIEAKDLFCCRTLALAGCWDPGKTPGFLRMVCRLFGSGVKKNSDGGA